MKCNICRGQYPDANGKNMQSINTENSKIDLEVKIRKVLSEVYDPEIPVLSIIDLGILKDVKLQGELVEIIITPTYSGCPAMDVISSQIRITLLENGIKNLKISQQLSPAWTSDWMTEEGKEKLQSYGIAPPVSRTNQVGKVANVICPLCHSNDTKVLSEFGSTSCKALYQCNTCKEPFDHFKCH